jgi:hypothetical protein
MFLLGPFDFPLKPKQQAKLQTSRTSSDENFRKVKVNNSLGTFLMLLKMRTTGSFTAPLVHCKSQT